MTDIVDSTIKGLMRARERRLKKEAEAKHEQSVPKTEVMPSVRMPVMSGEDYRVLLLTKMRQHIKMKREQNQ
jgi:hypothetical protein